jgi:hypothetical protein
MKTKIEISKSANESAKEMLNMALSMVKNTTGFVRANGKHQCIDKLEATIRHNEHASSIYLLNHRGEAEAFFHGNNFWSMTTKTLVTLQ